MESSHVGSIRSFLKPQATSRPLNVARNAIPRSLLDSSGRQNYLKCSRCPAHTADTVLYTVHVLAKHLRH